MLPPFKHQGFSTEFILDTQRCFDMSDPGTGKTRSALDAMRQIQGKTLVLAPLSILVNSWLYDIQKFTPDETAAVAYAKNRTEAFNSNADIVITNHDAVKWIVKQIKKDSKFLSEYSTLIIDEFTAYKNRTTQRSSAVLKISEHFENIIQLSGTPNSNGVLNTWHPAFLLDGGDRLGKNFFQFRSQVCTPYQTGPRPEMREWVEKDDAVAIVGSLLADITIRYELEDCIDMPPHSMHTIYVELPPNIRKRYEDFKRESILLTENGAINAVHAGVRVRKLLQLLTGAIYDGTGTIHGIHKERYELVLDLVEAREHCLVAFNWKHERNELINLAEKRGLTYAVIDGDTPVAKRVSIVDDFQLGRYKVLFAHPQSAGHGLTLTKATSTIWSSPTYNAEYFQQFNKRIYRAGQTERSETIMIAATDTAETDVYEKLNQKMTRMNDLLGIFSNITRHTTKGH